MTAVAKEVSLTLVLTTGALLLAFGLFGFLGTIDERLFPELGILLLVVGVIVGAIRGARSSRVIAVAAGVTLPIVLLSILGTVSLARTVPGLSTQGGVARGLLSIAITAFATGAISAWLGRTVWRRVARNRATRRADRDTN